MRLLGVTTVQNITSDEKKVAMASIPGVCAEEGLKVCRGKHVVAGPRARLAGALEWSGFD